MTSQDLQKWALVAEIIGGIAIVISLGIVAFELDQSTEQAALNTSALEIASYQDLIKNITELNEAVIDSPLLMSAINKSQFDPESMTDEERTAAYIYYISLFRHGDSAYFQYKRGAIDRERLDSILSIMTFRLQHPFVKDFSESQKTVFVSEYQKFIDNYSVAGREPGIDF